MLHECHYVAYRTLSAYCTLQVFYDGTKNLVYAETRMNKHSSRSHAILQIRVTKWARPVGSESVPALGRIMCICLSQWMAQPRTHMLLASASCGWHGVRRGSGLRRSSGAGGCFRPPKDGPTTMQHATMQHPPARAHDSTRTFRPRARPRMGRLLARSPSCRSSTSLGRSG